MTPVEAAEPWSKNSSNPLLTKNYSPRLTRKSITRRRNRFPQTGPNPLFSIYLYCILNIRWTRRDFTVNLRQSIAFTLIVAFIVTSLYIPSAQAGEMVLPRLPAPGVMVHLSPEFTPAVLKEW